MIFKQLIIASVFLVILFVVSSESCGGKKVNDAKKPNPQTQTPAVPNVNKTEGRVPEGKWGGQHVRLEVSKDGAEVEFDCAHGRLNGPLILQNGRFATTGTFVRERGRVRADGVEQGQTTYFRGEINGSRMTLVLSFSEGDTEGETFTLTHGADGRLYKCK